MDFLPSAQDKFTGITQIRCVQRCFPAVGTAPGPGLSPVLHILHSEYGSHTRKGVLTPH